MDVCVKIKTYRHNFSKNFMDEISIFSKIHQYDDRQTFKDEYMKWYSENVDLIDKEKRLLKNNEYCGNIDDKIYFACRYYFRKKSNKIEDEEKKKRNLYLTIPKDLINEIDTYIKENISVKPHNSFINFCNEKQNVLSKIIKFIVSNKTQVNITENDKIQDKIKKLYKNRIYLMVQEIKKNFKI